MIDKTDITGNPADNKLAVLTRSILYEGYSLYPYYRSAVKNQMPVPFGVIFPQDYAAFHEHAPSRIQSECIIAGISNPSVTIQVRFLQVRKTEVFEKRTGDGENGEFIAVARTEVNDRCLESGWQTIERNHSFECRAADLINRCKILPVAFDSWNEGEMIFNADKKVVAKLVTTVSATQGMIGFAMELIEGKSDAYRLTVVVTNATHIDQAATISRDAVLGQSFLSSNIVFKTGEAQFISHLDPPSQWQSAIDACRNIHTWPIIVDDDNRALLSSPIILNDHPQINPQSAGDLFDSTEIEEALLLHVNLLSEQEKERICSNDPKLQAMLNKVSSLTPGDLSSYHSMMKEDRPGKFVAQ